MSHYLLSLQVITVEQEQEQDQGKKDVQMKISMNEKNLSSTQVMKTKLLVLFTIP